MMRFVKVIGALVVATLAAAPARGQDLLKRHPLKEDSRPVVRYTRNSLSLSLRPGLTLADPGGPAETSVRFGANLDWNFACGQFDLRANLRHTFTRELRDRALRQLLDIAQGELIANGLTLLCTSAPSLCDVFKYYHLYAQGQLKLQYDKCARIEEAIQTGQKRARAAAIQACLREKLSKNVPLEQAMQECEQSDPLVSDLFGRRVARVDLVGELKKVFGLDEQTSRDLERIFGNTTMTAKGLQGRADPQGGARLYEETKRKYQDHWEDALQRARRGELVRDEELAQLLPYSDLRVARSELLMIAHLDPEDQRIIRESLVSQAAIADLVRRLQTIDRYLEAADRMPGAEGNPVFAQYQKMREVLQSELARVQREYEQKVATQQRLLEILEAARARSTQKAAEVLNRSASIKAQQRMIRSLPRYGTYNPLGPGDARGSGQGDDGSRAASTGPCCSGSFEVGFGRR